jgi:hypothetical protein
MQLSAELGQPGQLVDGELRGDAGRTRHHYGSRTSR